MLFPVASALTVLAHLGDVWLPIVLLDDPVRTALLTSVVSWLLVSLLLADFAGPQHVNRNSYSLLEPRISRLERLVRALWPAAGPGDEPCETAREQLEWLKRNVLGARDTGARWILGFGYVEAWRRLHRAEEAILMKEEVELIGYANEDFLRARGSDMGNKTDLVGNVLAAVRTLRPDALAFFPKGDREKVEADTLATSHHDARCVLRRTRQTINVYRDDKHSGLINARNVLAIVTIAMSLIAYAILVIAIASGAPKTAVASAAIFILTGAAVGVFARMRADAQADSAVDDYGLSSVRLVATAIAAGLAGVAGVVAVAFLATALTERPTSEVTLAATFDLVSRPAGLVVAAIFGASPSLLIDVFTSKADQYKKSIVSTNAADGTEKGSESGKE